MKNTESFEAVYKNIYTGRYNKIRLCKCVDLTMLLIHTKKVLTAIIYSLIGEIKVISYNFTLLKCNVNKETKYKAL